MSRTLGDAFVRIRPDTSTFGSELRADTSDDIEKAGHASGSAYAGGVEKSGIASRLGRVAKVAGAALGAAGLYGAAAFTKQSVGLEQAFGKTMNMFKANANATQGDMRKMSALALQMGKDTVFSANDAASAMLELAKNGMSPATIQAGALKEALTLAAAGGVGMEEAATVMGNALNAFELKGKQSAQVSAALAGAANASSASVQSLAYGLQAAATSAHASGFSIQETTAVLAAFENAGIKGSDAGTSMKTMLARLIPTSDSAATAMENVGLWTKKTGSAFVDVHGNFKSASEIAGLLHDKLGKLSQAEQAEALNAIFGSDARRAATILMNQGQKGLEKYIKATSDQTAADKQAAAAMKGTAGAIEARKGSVETLGLAFGMAIKPITIFANRLIADVANKAVPVVQVLGKKIREFIRDSGGMSGVLGHLDLGKVFGKLKSAIAGIDWHSAASGASSLGAAFDRVDWASVKKSFGKGLSDSISVFSVAIGFAADHLDEFARVFPLLVAAFAAYKTAQAAASVAEIGRIPILAAQVVSTIALARANNSLATAITQSTLTENASTATKSRGVIATIASTVAQKAAAAASKVWAAGQWLLNAALTANPIGLVVVAIAGLVAGIVIAYRKSETFRNIVNGAFNAVVRTAQAVFGWIKSHWKLLVGILIGPFGIAVVMIVKHWDKIKAGASQAITATIGFIKSLPGRAAGAIGALGSTMLRAAVNGFGKLVDGYTRIVGQLLGFVAKLPGRIVARVSGLAGQMAEVGRNVARGIWAGLSEMSGWLTGKVWAWVKSVLPAQVEKALGIASPSKVAREQGRWYGKGLAGGLDDTQGLVKKKANDLAKALVKTLQDKLSKNTDLLATLRSSFSDLAGSVSQAFVPDLFSAESLSDLVQQQLGGLDNLDIAEQIRKRLKGLHIAGAGDFITKMFQSGNTDLIQQLGAAPADVVKAIIARFNLTNQRAAEFGNRVAGDDPQGSKMLDRMSQVRDLLKDIKHDLQQAKHHVATAHHRDPDKAPRTARHDDDPAAHGRRRSGDHDGPLIAVYDKSGDPVRTAKETVRRLAFAGGA